MNIRSLKPEDVETVAGLWRAAGLEYRPTGRDHPEELAAFIKENPDLCLAAESDGTLTGVAFGSDDGRKGWINRLAVHPAHRRKGIAAALLQALENSLHARGRQVIASLVMEENSSSLDLFKQAGYTHTDKVLYLRKSYGEDA